MAERIKKNQAAIFGGEGNMGRVTTELFHDIGFETISHDPKLIDGPTAAEVIDSSRVIFFSVLPIEEVAKIIEESEDQFTENHQVLDNASLKDPLIDAYRKLEQKGVSICSTHPLCKHDQPLHGQKALILEVGQNSASAKEVAEQLYREAGMKLIDLPFSDHDRAMVVVQLVPHLVQRAVGSTLANMGVDMEKLREISPANFQLYYLSLWRTLVQDPRISATIITNLLDRREGQVLAEEIIASLGHITGDLDQDHLAKTLTSDFAYLNQGGIGDSMNTTTTTVLERLANLEAKSLSLEVVGDNPGRLREILEIFEEQGINLTAIDSHKLQDGVKFEIGIDENTISSEKMETLIGWLKAIGCRNVISSNGDNQS